MTKLEQAAQQALEALEHGQHSLKQVSEHQWESRGELAMVALRAALSEPQRQHDKIERLKAERDALKAAAEKGTEYVLAHINQDLKAERDALRLDAERYRYLRDHMWAQSGTKIYALPISWEYSPDVMAGDYMDAAIDAARRET